MPIYEYEVKEGVEGCDFCRTGFELVRTISEPPLDKCPRCKAAIRKLISPPFIGGSKSGLDARAKNAGFHKLQRIGKGEYEKKY